MPKIGEIHDRLTAAEYKEVPAQFQSLYVEEGDAFVYKDPKVLKESMVNAKGEKQTLATKLAEYEAKFKDIDPEEARALKAKAKDFENIDKVTQGQIDQVKKDLEQKYGSQLTAAQQKVVDREARYANRILSDDIKTALAKAGVTESGAELLTGNLRNAITVKMGDDGEPEFRVLDEKGQQRLNDSADPVSIADLVMEAKKKHPQLFGSAAGSGAGSGQGDKNVAAPSDGDTDAWTDAQKQAYIRQHGHEAYRTLLTKNAARKTEARNADRTKRRA